MLTLVAIDQLAGRIERAYLHRHPRWRDGSADPRVWTAAAVALVQLHQLDPTMPIDPELYVASQPPSPLGDPWGDLTQAQSARRYRRQVAQIVRTLRDELRGEVRRAEARVRRGQPLAEVLRSKGSWLSPLGRYIVAIRAGRPDLAGRFRAPARAQHRGCPLYRPACARLLPGEAYPVSDPAPGAHRSGRGPSRLPQFSLN